MQPADTTHLTRLDKGVKIYLDTFLPFADVVPFTPDLSHLSGMSQMCIPAGDPGKAFNLPSNAAPVLDY